MRLVNPARSTSETPTSKFQHYILIWVPIKGKTQKSVETLKGKKKKNFNSNINQIHFKKIIDLFPHSLESSCLHFVLGFFASLVQIILSIDK